MAIDLKQYGITANGKYVVYVNVGEYSINFVNVTANFPLTFSVSVPESAYYTFDGSEEVKQGKAYSFGINPTNAALNDFVVFVNDEKVEGADGRYTVENVQGNLTIKVLHGYIIVASGKTATVEYNGSTLKLINSTGVGHAYISAEYIAYMKSIGYTSVKFKLAPDGAIAAQACVAYNGKRIMKTDVAGTEIEYELSDDSSILEFWGQDSGGSGYQIRDSGSYLTITNLRFAKPAQGVNVLEEMYAEVGGETLFVSDKFVVGDAYSVTVNGETITTTVTTDSQLSVNFTTLTVGKTYSAVCENENYKITFANVFAATKVIRTVGDLSVLAEGDAERTESITGYYVLGNDIDAKGTRVSSGYKWDAYGFAGTLDGRGHTISDIKAGTTGIFGQIQGGTVKNINFIDVTICEEWGAALFAVVMQNSILSNVSVTYKEISADDTTVSGLLMSRVTAGNYTNWQNVTLDARGLHVPCLFGSQATLTGTNVAFKNVTIYAGSYNAVAYTDAGTATKITELPSGVTVEIL